MFRKPLLAVAAAAVALVPLVVMGSPVASASVYDGHYYISNDPTSRYAINTYAGLSCNGHHQVVKAGYGDKGAKSYRVAATSKFSLWPDDLNDTYNARARQCIMTNSYWANVIVTGQRVR